MSNTTMLIILAVIFILSGVVIWLTNRGTGPGKVEEPIDEHVEEKRVEDKRRAKEERREEKVREEKRREEKP